MSKGAASLLVVLAVALTVAATPAAGAEEPVPSNLDLMIRLSNEVVEDILAKIENDVRGRRLMVKPYASTEDYLLLDDVFTRVLEARGIEAVGQTAQTTAATDATVDKPYLLDFKLPVFRLSYPDVYRNHMVGGKKVRREASVRVSAKLLSDTGDIVWIGESQAATEDQFSHGDRKRVEEGTYAFVKPEMPNSNWGKIVEPVFVSAIIVGMIYLFFSNQSDS